MKKLIALCLLLFASEVYTQTLNLNNNLISIVDGVLIAKPIVASRAFVPVVFSKWITFENGDSLKLDDLPANSLIQTVTLWVQQSFNAFDSTMIQVGYSSDKDAYIKQVNCNSTGVKTDDRALDGARVGKSENVSRSIYIYKNDIGSYPTRGKACITIWFVVIDLIP